MTDEEIIGEIGAIRARNNQPWMGILRIALRYAPEETKVLLRQIAEADGEVRRLTQALATDDEDDHAVFTHLREAWGVLRGKE